MVELKVLLNESCEIRIPQPENSDEEFAADVAMFEHKYIQNELILIETQSNSLHLQYKHSSHTKQNQPLVAFMKTKCTSEI